MSERPHDHRRLDVRSFAAQAGRLNGSDAAAGFERLTQSVLAGVAPVVWSAQGEQRTVAGEGPQTWLHLQAQTDVTLTCQRCLQPLPESVQVDRHYQFVTSEQEAERLDDLSEHEVLVLARQIDVFDLLEDELILALPIVPRHDQCPQPLVAGGVEAFSAETEEAPHAFAALAALRRPPLAN